MAAITGEGQEIDQLAIRDRTVLSQIWEFRRSHPTHLQTQEKENEIEQRMKVGGKRKGKEGEGVFLC